MARRVDERRRNRRVGLRMVGGAGAYPPYKTLWAWGLEDEIPATRRLSPTIPRRSLLLPPSKNFRVLLGPGVAVRLE